MYTIRKAFTNQRHRAKTRDIAWELTYKQWLKVWGDSGHFHDRGLKGDGYVMSRFNDLGPYAVDNVEIIKHSANVTQEQVMIKRAQTLAARPDDWEPTGRYKHLKDRDNHPKSRAVVCPDGVVYPSAAVAGEVHGRTRATISHRCRTGWGGWHFQG